MVKTLKSLDVECDRDYPILAPYVILSQVQTVEEKLQIESSERINDTLTNDELQTAGEMFLYLYACPKHDMEWFISWSSFYTDLFSQSADQIILTLNRMMESKILQDKDGGKFRAEKLQKRTSSLMSLNYDQIQSLRPNKAQERELL